ncbi:MAG: M23 family metallopeptidase [Bdellovibrionota bacterium]
MKLLYSALILLTGCSTVNPYLNTDSSAYKKISIPLNSGTAFFVSQGTFGKASHSEPGNEYSWDFDVPFGSDVISVEDGKVIEIWAPNKGGGCNSKYSELAHNIKIKSSDGTVAQYVHVEAIIKQNQNVKRGQVIARTANNGFLCRPQLHFGIYNSESELYRSPTRKTLPLYFEGIENGLALEGHSYIAP